MVKWEEFALHLPGICQSDIDDINTKAHDDSDDQKKCLFRRWLEKYPDVSWEQVVLALEKSDQKVIAQKFVDSASCDIQVHPDTAECLLELNEQFCVITEEFECAMEELMKSKQLCELKRFVSQRKAYDIKDKLSNVEKFQDFINVISDHYDFLYHKLLADLVRRFLPESALSQKLKEHDENVEKFRKNTEIEKLRNALYPYKITKLKTETPLTIKVNDPFEKEKLYVLNVLIKPLLTYLDAGEVVVKPFRVIPGSLTIVLLLQQHVSQALLDNFDKEKMEFLRLVGVISLQVGTKYVLEDDENTKYTFEKGFINAVQASNYEAIEFLLQQIGVDVNTTIVRFNENSAIIAADFHDTNKVFLDENNNIFLSMLDIGATALMMACHKNDFRMLQLLLQQQPDTNLCTESGWTALMYTAINGNTTILKFLLDINADVNMRKHSDGATAVMYASLVGNVGIIKMLVQHSADLNLQMTDGRTALFLASERNNVQAVEELLHAKAKPDIPSNDGTTPLLIATKKDHLSVAGKLLKHLTLLQSNDREPLAIASLSNRPICILGTTDSEDSSLHSLKEKMNTSIHLENETYKQRLKAKGKALYM